jgi:hypothetical protein
MIAPGGRLLPASIPFRFLAAALMFHLAGWTALAAGAPLLASVNGGLGLPLAGLHLMTLGVLTVTAMGAGFQLLPVAIQADLPNPPRSWNVVPADPAVLGHAPG